MPKEIAQVKFKPGLPLEIEVLPLAATVAQNGAQMSQPHRAEFYHLFWFQEGRAEYRIDFQPLAIQAPCFLFVGRERVQAFDRQSPHDGRLLLFTDSFFASSQAHLDFLHNTPLFHSLRPAAALPLPATPALAAAFQAIENECSLPNDEYHHPLLQNLLHNLMLLAEREQSNHQPLPDAGSVDRSHALNFRRLLEAQFHTRRSVGDYAAQMNLSEKRLAQATRALAGKPPKVLIDERVMLEARRLLLYTQLSVKELAHRLGFDEPTNFIKFFRKHENRTPSEFREAQQPGRPS